MVSPEKLPTWDLTDLFPSPHCVELAQTENLLVGKIKDFVKTYKPRTEAWGAADAGVHSLAISDTFTSSQQLFKALQDYEEIQVLFNRLGSYRYLYYATRVNDNEASNLLQKTQDFLQSCAQDLVFLELAICAIQEDELAKWLQEDENLAVYSSYLDEVRLSQDYQLPEQVEQTLLAKSSVARTLWVKLYDETLAELTFNSPSEKKDSEELLNLSKILNLLLDSSKEVRDNAANSLKTGLAPQEKLITSVLNSIVKDHAVNNKLRGFKKNYSSMNLHNRITDEVMETLVSTVRGSYSAIPHQYYKAKAEILGLKKLQYWDRNAPLFASNKEYSFAEAQTLVLDAFHGFCPEMARIAKLFFDKGWIDAHLRRDKMSGAFSHPAVTSVHPYVLVNYHGKYLDVSTLAHELGHGVHQYLAKEVGELQAGTPLVLAETASIFGEELLFDHVMKQTNELHTRRYLLANKIEGIINSVHRQIAFHCFELKVHETQSQKTLTKSDLREFFISTQRECLGDAVDLSLDDGIFWTYVSHFFHVPFYVYAYAFGDCLVRSLYSSYKKAVANGINESTNFVSSYLELLSQGGKRSPKDAIAKFGFNITSENFWRSGLEISSGLVDELLKIT